MKRLKFEERLSKILSDYKKGFYSSEQMTVMIENLASSSREEDKLLRHELIIALATFITR